MRLIRRLRSRGGYAMVYVVVAMTLMLAVVGGITATAARNLQTQQSAVSMMVDRYKAAGEVEAKFAWIANFSHKTDDPIPENDFNLIGIIMDSFSGFGEIDDYNSDVEYNKEIGSFNVKVVESNENTAVTAVLSVHYSVMKEATGESTPAADLPEDPKYTYTVTVTSVEYQSYNVEYKGAGT